MADAAAVEIGVMGVVVVPGMEPEGATVAGVDWLLVLLTRVVQLAMASWCVSALLAVVLLAVVVVLLLLLVVLVLLPVQVVLGAAVEVGVVEERRMVLTP